MSFDPLPYYRQSLIAWFDQCPLGALFSLLDLRRTPGPFAARGTLFHRFVHRAQRQMWETGERRFPIDMGMELLLDVLCQRDVAPEDVVPLAMEQIKWLRILVVKWCENIYMDARRIVGAEERLFADLALPTGETVKISGQLDLLLADPPNGLIDIDYKSGTRRPPQPRNPEKAETEGTGLTPLGWTQSLIYSWLIFENFPSVDRVVFREIHVMRWEERQVRTERWQMERLRDLLASQVALLHQAIQEGPKSPRWMPSAGAHCAMCVRPRDCPIKDQEGIPANYKEAQQAAQEWIVAGETRKRRSEYIKGWVDQYGPIEVPHARGRRVVGWDLDPNGKRNFAMFEPKDVPESPYDDILAEAARDAKVLKG